MKKIIITGGAGFIGSHIVEKCAEKYKGAEIVIFDKMTYAADVRNILPLITANKARLLVGDVANFETCRRAVEGADLVIHAAAESHVDNSFGNSLEFTKTNVAGTHCLMESCRLAGTPRIIHVSTDEVYGEVHEGSVDENAVLRPTNPYSASKAAAEMIINGYRQSFKIPVIIIRANNIFGIRQFPEKIIPKFLISAITGRKMTLHGSGKNVRHYLSAHDLTDAIDLLVQKGEIGGCYNIGTLEDYPNIEIARMICAIFGLKEEDYVTYVADRPFNDARYAVDWSRLSKLGWQPRRRLADELPAMAEWYTQNLSRYENSAIVNSPVQSKAGAVA